MWYIKGCSNKNANLMRGGAVVARQAHNLKAVGSIPTPATNEISGAVAKPQKR